MVNTDIFDTPRRHDPLPVTKIESVSIDEGSIVPRSCKNENLSILGKLKS
jgi:hypothetical protein